MFLCLCVYFSNGIKRLTLHYKSKKKIKMINRLYSLILIVLVALSAKAASGETADWYLYYWSSANNTGGDFGQFVTTDDANVFVLKNVNIAENGLSFCVRNGAWSTVLGWSDEGGSVNATGTDVKLATATQATGWLALPAGTYDVTFDAANLTIRFDAVSGETGITTVSKQIPADGGACYNLAGQRVGKNAKGIVVKNGRKYIKR